MDKRKEIERRIELKRQLIMITRKEIKELEGLLKVKVDIKNDNMA